MINNTKTLTSINLNFIKFSKLHQSAIQSTIHFNMRIYSSQKPLSQLVKRYSLMRRDKWRICSNKSFHYYLKKLYFFLPSTLVFYFSIKNKVKIWKRSFWLLKASSAIKWDSLWIYWIKKRSPFSCNLKITWKIWFLWRLKDKVFDSGSNGFFLLDKWWEILYDFIFMVLNCFMRNCFWNTLRISQSTNKKKNDSWGGHVIKYLRFIRQGVVHLLRNPKILTF